MGILKNIAANRIKRVQIRNDRKLKVKEAEFASNNLAYENGVTPAAGAAGKWSAVAQSGLGIVKGFLGQKNPDPLPLPDDEPMSDKTKIGIAICTLLGIGVLVFIVKKK